MIRTASLLCALGGMAIGATASQANISTPRPATPSRGVSATGMVWQFTYLKAHPGASVDSLARVITSNWFAMDAKAVAAGDLAGYHLIRGSAADTTWDLLEIAVFRDSVQHARADSVYRVRYRPAHRPVLVGGRDLAGWGRIVKSEPLRYVAGGP